MCLYIYIYIYIQNSDCMIFLLEHCPIKFFWFLCCLIISWMFIDTKTKITSLWDHPHRQRPSLLWIPMIFLSVTLFNNSDLTWSKHDPWNRLGNGLKPLKRIATMVSTSLNGFPCELESTPPSQNFVGNEDTYNYWLITSNHLSGSIMCLILRHPYHIYLGWMPW